MREISLKGLDEMVYEEVLDNGLKIYIWKSLKAHSFQGVMNVYFGADDLEFVWKNRKYTLHRGAAHYLEHVMCELPDEPLLSKFNKLGSHSNANTNYIRTSFEFEGTRNLKDNLLLLLQTIFEKEFNEKEVEHERNPIIEEQRMRLDNPAVISYFTLNDMLYNKYPNNTDLIGSLDDINAITLDELKLIYDAFYHPANMSLVLTGNVDPYEVVTIVKDYFKDREIIPFKEPKVKKYRESKVVNIKEKTIQINVEVPEVTIDVKVPASLFKEYDDVKLFNILQVIMSANFDSTSMFKEELLEKRLIYNLNFSAYKMNDYIILEVGCRTPYPDEVKKVLLDKLNNMQIYYEDIERKIKSSIATLVLSYEDIEEVNNILSGSLIYHGRIIDNEKELLESITKEDLENVFNLLSLKETAILTVLPKED